MSSEKTAADLGKPVLVPRTTPVPKVPDVFSTPLDDPSRKVNVRRLFLVVNPFAGVKKGTSLGDYVFKTLTDAGVQVTRVHTERAGHAIDMCKELDCSLYDAVACIGGDGTVHECVNGFLLRTDGNKLPLAVIPGGSGNSLMYDIDKKGSVERAVQRILDGQTHPLDAGEIDLRESPGSPTIVRKYFVNILAWGMMADAAARAERMRWLGPSRYTAAGVLEILLKRRRLVKLVMNGAHVEGPKDMLLVGIQVNQHSGKGLRFCPHSKWDDGLLDVIAVESASRMMLFRVLDKCYSGKHVAMDPVQYYQVKSVSVIPEVDTPVVLDGEIVHGTPFDVKCVKGAIDIFV